MNLKLGYLVFGVRDVRAWRDFCDRMLGLPAPVENADGSLGWRIDAATQRLIVREDASDDLAALGFDCGSAEELERVANRLRAAGVPVEPAPAALLAARRVAHLRVAHDPAGNAVELFCGAERAAGSFHSAAFPGGFHTGDAGMGHVALVGTDLDAMERFYAGLLGFAVTERLSTRAGPIDIQGVFLHCNRRHHSLALFRMPSTKRVHHFMLQARTHMDVGRALERAHQVNVPLSLDLGQHPAPDGTFSFYGITPSGFDFEIGAGSGEIEPGNWQAVRTTTPSSWGHRPQWRLKWRIVSAAVRQKMRVRRRA